MREGGVILNLAFQDSVPSKFVVNTAYVYWDVSAHTLDFIHPVLFCVYKDKSVFTRKGYQ
jgi:hypothetical protein